MTVTFSIAGGQTLHNYELGIRNLELAIKIKLIHCPFFQ